MRSLILLSLLCFSVASYAQSGKKKDKKKQKETAEVAAQPTSLNPETTERHESRKSRKAAAKSGTTYNAERNYYERIEALEKERLKNEKNMDKPQYSDPMYFGHKRPPKKRAPNKMKFCKVCGIRH